MKAPCYAEQFHTKVIDQSKSFYKRVCLVNGPQRFRLVLTGSSCPLQVDTQLACMMSENSVDYIARFNDLAQELSVTEPSLPPPGV